MLKLQIPDPLITIQATSSYTIEHVNARLAQLDSLPRVPAFVEEREFLENLKKEMQEHAE